MKPNSFLFGNNSEESFTSYMWSGTFIKPRIFSSRVNVSYFIFIVSPTFKLFSSA